MSDDAMQLDAMRLVLPLISSFVVGLHARTIAEANGDMTMNAVAHLFGNFLALERWHHEQLDQPMVQDAPHTLGGEVLVMIDFQHVENPIMRVMGLPSSARTCQKNNLDTAGNKAKWNRSEIEMTSK